MHRQQTLITQGLIKRVKRSGITYRLFLLVLLCVFVSACSSIPEQNNNLKSEAEFSSGFHYEMLGGPVPGAFSVERIELYSHSGASVTHQSEMFIPEAKINYKGAGTLIGHWGLDGRIYEPFVVHLNRGSLLKLRLKNKLNLKALTKGRHRLSLVISKPVPSYSAPVLEFYVD